MPENFIFIICMLSAIIYTASSQYTCQGTTTIKPPALLNESVVYPANWNSSLPAQQYAANLSCQWIITVPQGMYAFVLVRAAIGKADTFFVIDSTGYTENILTSNVFYYPTNFNLSLSSGPDSTATGNMSLLVQWSYFKSNAGAAKYSVNTNQPGVLSNTEDSFALITAQTRVSVMNIIPSLNDIQLIQYARSIMFFDGPNCNSTFLGSFYTGTALSKQIVSTSNTLSMYGLNLNIFGYIIYNDFKNVEEIGEVKSLYCVTSTSECVQSIDATQKPGALVTVIYESSAEYLMAAGINANSNLDVYIEPKTADKSNRIVSYSGRDISKQLPQEFLGTVRMYVLDSGKATFSLTHSHITAGWSNAVDGRSGFFMSRHYGSKSTNQKIYDYIATNGGIGNMNEEFVFTYSLEAQLAGNTSLEVQVLGGKKKLIDTINTPGNAVRNGTGQGTSFSMSYNTYGYETTGTLLHFSIAKSAHYVTGLSTIIISTLAMYYARII